MSFDWRAYRSVFALILVVISLAFLTQGTFLSARNLTNLTRQVALNGILAVGMTYVILIGGIDLSVGSVVALSGVVAGICQVNYGLGSLPANILWLGALISVVASIVTGTVAGAFNGWLITRHRIAPFIITLGTMVIARGFALIFSEKKAISPMSDPFNFLGQGYLPGALTVGLISFVALVAVGTILSRNDKTSADYTAVGSTVVLSGVLMWMFVTYRGLPVPVLIFAIFGIVGILILQRTRLGRFVLALGGNSEAAWLAGVPIQKITFGIYVTLGALAGLVGAILAARLNSAFPNGGELFELDAIAAVVIGGTSLLGGVGTVRGSIMGAFFIGALNNGMSLLNVDESYQKVIKGVIIILAVWMDMRQSGSTPMKK